MHVREKRCCVGVRKGSHGMVEIKLLCCVKSRMMYLADISLEAFVAPEFNEIFSGCEGSQHDAPLCPNDVAGISAGMCSHTTKETWPFSLDLTFK